MSFEYKKRSVEELEQIADVVFSRYHHRCSGCYVDIEGIIEDADLVILPREGGLRKYVEGYVAADPHFIIVSEYLTSYAPRFRPVIAEEFCHIVLEFGFIWDGLPPEAHPHKLTAQQHADIETDARWLARALLFPREKFKTLFNSYMMNAPVECSKDRASLLTYCGNKLETDFHVWSLYVGYRARDLGLITKEECLQYFSNKVPL